MNDVYRSRKSRKRLAWNEGEKGRKEEFHNIRLELFQGVGWRLFQAEQGSMRYVIIQHRKSRPDPRNLMQALNRA